MGSSKVIFALVGSKILSNLDPLPKLILIPSSDKVSPACRSEFDSQTKVRKRLRNSKKIEAQFKEAFSLNLETFKLHVEQSLKEEKMKEMNFQHRNMSCQLTSSFNQQLLP